MGKVRGPDLRTLTIPAYLLIGRGQAAGMRIEQMDVSNEHAVIEWRAGRWHVRDLASTNGTFLNGQVLKPGTPHALSLSDRLAFGCTLDSWEVVDESAPELFARCLRDGHEVQGVSGLLALPCDDNPEVQIMHLGGDHWRTSSAIGERNVEDCDIIEAGGEAWRLSLPSAREETRRADGVGATTRQLALTFLVSRDEETVAVEISGGSLIVPVVIEPRASNYLLLHLARLRLQDIALEPGEQGWIRRAELARDLRVDSVNLNVQVFRARRCFAELGVEDLGNAIESRGRPSELRLGIERFQIKGSDRRHATVLGPPSGSCGRSWTQGG
jgi:hypothetical protein